LNSEKRFLDEMLREALPFGLAVYGLAETWQRAPEDLRAAWRGVLPLGDIASLYSGARVVLGTTDRKQQTLGMINNRVFEALSCGATLIQGLVRDAGNQNQRGPRERTGHSAVSPPAGRHRRTPAAATSLRLRGRR
jgi:hypothetical protein